MKFTLLVGTLNRCNELSYCIHSLLSQSYDNYEIVIVDQSDNDKTEQYVAELNNNRIKYLHIKQKGLSHARNEGLKAATGEYICLIDDDAYYGEDYLEIAMKSVNDKTVLSGFILNTSNNLPYVSYSEANNERYLSKRSVIRTCPSAGLVIPRALFNDVGVFDERFGVGSEFSSGEETDVLLRGMGFGYKVMYLNSLKLEHPCPKVKDNIYTTEQKMHKRAKYLEGLGALLKKHIANLRDYSLCGIVLENEVKLIIKGIVCKNRKITFEQLKCFNRGLSHRL